MNTLLPKTLFPFIWHFIKSYKIAMFFFCALAILAGLWGPFNSLLMKHVIDVLPQVTPNTLSILTWPSVLFLLNIVFVDNVAWRGIAYIYYKYLAIIKNNIIKETLSHVLSESHAFFQETMSGRISSQIQTLASEIESIVYRVAVDFLRSIALFFIAFTTVYYVNPMFFYTLITWAILFSILSLSLSKRLIDLADKYASTESQLSGQLVDVITNHSNVRIFSRRFFETIRMRKFFQGLQEAFQNKQWFLLVLQSIQGAMIAAMMGVALYLLVGLYGQGLVTVGDFALILGLTLEVGHMTWYMVGRIDDLNQSIGKCNQSLTALLVKLDIQDKEHAAILNVNRGEIKFKDVNFHYKNSKPLFNNLSITIKPGQKVGLVGYSGGGKSTFAHLILRLFDVTNGSVLIDGQDIREVTQDSLRNAIGMIPQEPTLFHRSLMDNIRYGKVDASDDDVINASKKAHTHEFISRLSEGYETLAGERGVKLSGGQRQRIAIARAILKDAPILMLDEATSQLDSITEELIQESIWDLMQHKTTLVIAHRLSTLAHMDRILVFEKGKIVEDGSHHQLLKKNGLYSRLWNSQVGGFLPDTAAQKREAS